jgi:hypothetical protein
MTQVFGEEFRREAVRLERFPANVRHSHSLRSSFGILVH